MSECRNRSENLINRKLSKFYNETVINFFFQLRKNVEKYSKAFGASVKIYDPFIKKNKNVNLKKNISDVLKNSDIVVICITYNKKNLNFVDSKFFNKLKKGSIFVNTSRDHYRTRITHSLEVSQIARTLAKFFKYELSFKTRLHF